MARAKLIIPGDWTPADGYCFMRIRVPDSVQWRGLIVGQISDLAHPIIYDEETGNPDDAAQLGVEMLSNITRQGCSN